MDPFSTPANLAGILGIVIVIGSHVFPLIQLRQMRQQRRDITAITLSPCVGSPVFARASPCVLWQPEGLEKSALRAMGDGTEKAAVTSGRTTANRAVPVFHRIVSGVREPARRTHRT
jgi:hypothetical protein